MTWRKALPVIIVAFLFDLTRAFFTFFWLLGPAIAAGACTAGGQYLTGAGATNATDWAIAGLCSATAAAGGYLFSAPLILFGTVMAFLVGIVGWLVIGTWVGMTNPRIFAENLGDVMHVVFFYLALLIPHIPIIGCAPAVGAITWRMYKYQIKVERKALKEYEEEQAAHMQEQRALQVRAALMEQQALDENQMALGAQEDEEASGQREELPGEGERRAEQQLPRGRLVGIEDARARQRARNQRPRSPELPGQSPGALPAAA